MINGSDLRDFYIDAWRNIPGLVTAVGGDEGNIRAHSGVSHIAKSLQQTVESMPEGSIVVCYQGFRRGQRGKTEITLHEVAAFVRALDNVEDTNIAFGALMIDGVPVGAELAIRYLTFSTDCDPMDMPRYERVSAAQLSIDIWKLTITVPENFG